MRPPNAARCRAHSLPTVFRLSSHADPAFLAEMLYEVVNWRDDGAEERPPLDELLERPEIRRYVEDWGRIGDVAIVALDRLDEPVGAAWFRQFTADGARLRLRRRRRARALDRGVPRVSRPAGRQPAAGHDREPGRARRATARSA